MAVDRISKAQSFSEFLKAINEKYALSLPTDFLDDDFVSNLFEKSIKVKQRRTDNILYEARGEPLDFPPFTLGYPTLKMIIVLIVSKVPD